MNCNCFLHLFLSGIKLSLTFNAIVIAADVVTSVTVTSVHAHLRPHNCASSGGGNRARRAWGHGRGGQGRSQGCACLLRVVGLLDLPCHPPDLSRHPCLGNASLAAVKEKRNGWRTWDFGRNKIDGGHGTLGPGTYCTHCNCGNNHRRWRRECRCTLNTGLAIDVTLNARDLVT